LSAEFLQRHQTGGLDLVSFPHLFTLTEDGDKELLMFVPAGEAAPCGVVRDRKKQLLFPPPFMQVSGKQLHVEK
jgi:hypothetical protein